MNEIQSFNFRGNNLRTLLIDNKPFFVGKDAAKTIGYKNYRDAVNNHVKEKYRRVSQITTPYGNQEMTVISEPGLYQLASQSKLPSAEPFQDWVYEEVLPSIRKHGAYMTPETIEKALLDPDTIIQLATSLKSERQKRLIAEQQVNELTPKAEYTDKILANPGLETTSMIAKNYGMSSVAFNKLLHEQGIQYRQGKTWLLYAKYQNKGYTHVEPFEYIDSNGLKQVRNTSKWTQKGQKFLYDKLIKVNIKPVIELVKE